MGKHNTEITITKLMIETTSPMAINTGGREIGADTQLVRDTNGLPKIPASAIAGVWRHLMEECPDLNALKNKWFGVAEGTNSLASNLSISDGKLLDSKDKLPPIFSTLETLKKDQIFKQCLQAEPHFRDRVALNDRGVAKENAKFEQILLPKGLRFQITLQWSNRRDDSLTQQEWLRLLSLWQHYRFAFGASTRNGLGRINVVGSEQKTFSLSAGAKSIKDFSAFRAKTIPPTHKMDETIFTQLSQDDNLHSIKLEALDVWRCGNGSSSEPNISITTYTEPKFCRKSGKVEFAQKQPVLCGSSIKGILAHRIAYHYRKHMAIWAESMENASNLDWEARPYELAELLGYADEKDSSKNLASSLWVEDAEITSHQGIVTRTHNSIDRFTGGVRKGALYTEELLFKPKFTVNIYLAKPLTKFSTPIQAAFKDTLNDLKTGLLPMGAGSGRGTSLVVEETGANA